MSDQWLSLGPHRYRQSDDVFEWSPSGVVELQHAEQLVALVLAHSRVHSYLAILTDGRALQPLPSQARAQYVKALRDNPHLTTLFVVFGAHWLTQVSQTLVMRAAARLSSIPLVLRHVDTREQGESILRQLIVEHQSRTTPRP